MMRLHNSASGKVEEFVPQDSERITMYVCGPTVYGEPHVGNARPVVVFDVLCRLLQLLYPKVEYARNITDIDDKIIAAAQQAGVSAQAWAERWTEAFHDAAKRLGTAVPAHEPRATEHIGSMTEMIEQLIQSGYAYAADGHVLFDVSSYPAYGCLSHRSTDDMIAGARVEVAENKRNPADFVLWKPAHAEQPGWKSPWGRGRPGWHIECSAMIRACLGETIDIHGGGNDLLFPHHENEHAQSCCVTGHDFLARYWMHNGQITVAGRKMSKSEGNFSVLSAALAAYSAEAVRYALLSAHYRSPLEWNEALLQQSQAAVGSLYRTLASVEQPVERLDKPPEKIIAALADDLNTPKALSFLHDLAATANRSSGSQRAETAAGLAAAAQAMGLLVQDPESWLHQADAGSISSSDIEELISQRAQAREQRDFALADELRDQLADSGVVIEDGSAGTTWRRR